MTSKPKFISLDRADANQFEEFFRIYSESIEKSEQKPKEAIQKLSSRNDYSIRLLYSESALSGFSLSYLNLEKKFALLEYMAVDQSKRSHGLGADLLRDLTTSLFEKHMNWLVLEVDSPYQTSADQSLRVRRVDFYKKNRCREVEKLDYILPLPSAPPDLSMKLMLYDIQNTASDTVSALALREIVQDIYVSVDGCDASDARLEKMFSNLPKVLNLKK